MNNWKDLEIGNIPSDFFVNERIELCSDKLNESEIFIRQQVKNRINVIVDLGQGIKYRYRLKPLESIRITEDMALDLCTYISTAKNKSADFYHTEDLGNHYNRKVEIIGDGE